jgi:hypothetical protein
MFASDFLPAKSMGQGIDITAYQGRLTVRNSHVFVTDLTVVVTARRRKTCGVPHIRLEKHATPPMAGAARWPCQITRPTSRLGGEMIDKNETNDKARS